jgi:hypothetical protein
VRTPFFAVLPHDDVWHPRYLERLLAALHGRPDVVCAHTDMLCFGRDGADAGVVGQQTDDADLAPRILSWFLDGATGDPWHGLTRSSVLDRDFPTNEHRGFAVECEWVLHLLSQGRVLRVPEPLYLKRMPTTRDSVSASWFWDEAFLPAALDHHRERLLEGIPVELEPADAESITVAAEAAMLRRWQEFSSGRWGLPSRNVYAAKELLVSARRLSPDIATRVTATLKWVLSRHWHAIGDLDAAEAEARDGLAAVPDDALLAAQLGWLLVARGSYIDAMELGLQANRSHPNHPGLRSMLRACEGHLEAQLRPRDPDP